MSMGPVFECPRELLLRIPMLASSMGVRVEVLKQVEPNGPMGRYVFKTWFGTIIGELYDKNNVSQIWLHFPWVHAFNPLCWFADFRLSSKIESLLRENGAQSSKLDFQR